MNCEYCGRDVTSRYHYETATEGVYLCTECQRKLWRAQGWHEMADRDETLGRVAGGVFTVLRWCAAALSIVILIGIVEAVLHS